MLLLRFFGSFQANLGNQPVAPPRAKKVLLLLLILALRGGKPLDRTYLAGTLWPDSGDSDGAMNLRRALSDLRQWLGPEAERLQSPTRPTVSLSLTNATVDVLAFDEAARTYEKQGDIAAAEQAITFFRGTLMEGFDEIWLMSERAVREEQCREMLEALARHALAQRDYGRAVTLARRAERLDPLAQSIQRILYEALARSGDLPAVLRAYRDFRIVLHREANQEPDAQTVALIARVRQESYKVSALEPEEAPAAPNPESHLPVFLTPFVGRTQEITALTARLSEPITRLLTLIGLGGIGKTRLAIAVATQFSEARQEVRFVDLASLAANANREVIYTAILRALDDTISSPADVRRQIAQTLRGRRILLVMDNCEHIGPAMSEVIEAVLKDSPLCQVLATSRVALGVPGEIQWPVAPVVQNEAVLLFTQRARAAQPDFALTLANQDTVAALCHQLEGIPLALELAAARLRVLPLKKIQERLVNRLNLLTADSPTLPQRQRTMRGALEWSYTLLTPDEQQLLRALSIFAGGWTLEAAEAIFDTRDEPLDLLTRLVEFSLTIPGERFRLLEITREFAAEKLRESPQEAEEVQQRHYDFCLAIAKETEENIWGPNLHIYLDRQDTEQENCRAAILQANGGDALTLCNALANYWKQRGYYREGVALFTTALDKCASEDANVNPITIAQARNWLGRFKQFLGEAQDAENSFREGIQLSREIGDLGLLVSMLIALGSIYHEQGRIPEARAGYQEGMRLCIAAGDVCRATILRREMGILSHIEGDYIAARAQFEEALSGFRDSGARWDEMTGLWWTGFACQALNDFDAALTYYEESLTLARDLRSQSTKLTVLQSLADLARDRGAFAEARERYEETLPLAAEVGDWYKEAVAWRGMSEASRGLGDPIAALRYSQNAIALAHRANAPPLRFTLELISEAAAVATLAGQVETAVRLYAFVESTRADRNLAIPAQVRARHANDTKALRDVLGEATFATLWQDGANKTQEEIFAFLLTGKGR